MLRVIYFQMGAEQRPRILLIIHHLVVDGVSWRVLLEELQSGVEHLKRAETDIRLGAKSSSYKRWAEELEQYAQSVQMAEEREYWEEVENSEAGVIPVDYERGENRQASTRSIVRRLSPEQTRALLTEVPAIYHTEINDVLLLSLAKSIARWSGSARVKIELEGHGRELIAGDEEKKPVDLTRTVGWFTTIYPVILEVGEGRADGAVGNGRGDGADRAGSAAIGEEIKRVKEQLRRVPNKGIGYGVWKYLRGDGQRVEQVTNEATKAEILFNYLGQFDQVLERHSGWRVAAESCGTNLDEREMRHHLISINASVRAAELILVWSYSQDVHKRETIEQVAQWHVEYLSQIIEHCRSEEAGGYTPSDFPLARINQRELDEFLASLG
jgi:non-ribosomal peptide synthase protein (TIGR01720 family)